MTSLSTTQSRAWLRRRRRSTGLTLVEVLIVVALIAIMSAGVVFGSGMLTSSRQRAAATLVVSAVRMATTRANTTGRPVRLVFDMENQRLMLEETTGTLTRQKEKDSSGGGADPATEAEMKARAEADRILEGPKAPRARFSPVKQFGFDGDDPSQGRELGKGIRFRLVQTEHDEEPRKEGRAYLFFWPGGGTERAVIQVIRDGEPKAEPLSVVVSPLTGRAKLERGDVKLEAPHNDEEFGQVEVEQ